MLAGSDGGPGVGEERALYPSGTAIGKYTILSPLGSAGLGNSYLAQQQFLGRKVVLETLAPADDSLVSGMCEEARLLTSLDHPNIPDLYDADRHGGLPYIAWEYVTGWSLQQIVSLRGRPPALVALRIMATITGAVQHAHEKGIVHRSINPRNILMGSNGEPLLYGFWLSAPPSFLLSSDQEHVTGALAYVSPEQARGVGATVGSDLWGIGATTFFLLTGRPAYAATSSWETLNAIASFSPVDLGPLKEQFPDYVVDIVARCLRKDPTERYRTADDLRRGLEAVVDHLERADQETVEMALPRRGETLLLHAECREPGVTGAYRQFEFGAFIKGGAYGEVFRATEKETGRTVAVKVLKREWLDDEQAVARFRREAALLTRLSHPNIVRVHNFGRYGASFYIAMELLGDRTLREVMDERGPMEPREAVSIILPVLDGLAAVHEAGAIHRDLKPSNIAIMDDRVVVFDFGMASVADPKSLTLTGTFLGTAEYASPEQAAGEAAEAPSDVYSTGVILYEALTGALPHEAESVMGFLRKIATEPAVPVSSRRPDLPRQLAAFVTILLSRDAPSRPSAARAREMLAGLAL